MKHVLPRLFGEDPDNMIAKGSETTFDGELTEGFKYLENYVKGLE